MFNNFLRTTLRSLAAQKWYSLINILGLSIGLAAVILIVLYLQFELSYDRFHEEGDRLFRVSVVHKAEGKIEDDSPIFVPPIGPALQSELPEVAAYTRISTKRQAYLTTDQQNIKETQIHHADSAFFQLFNFPLLQGDPGTALQRPHCIVLSQSLAVKLFGEADPLGQMIKVNHQDSYEVTGVFSSLPANSHLQFEALLSFSSLYKDSGNYMGWNGGNQYITYVQLEPNVDLKALEAKFPEFMWPHLNHEYAEFNMEDIPYLQPLRDLHLYHNDYSDHLRTNLWVFGIVAILILFNACVNFVNLTTARATRRAREIGVRKTMGANRLQLVGQFLGESIIISTIAFAIALILVEFLSPVYGKLMNRPIDWLQMLNLPSILFLLAILLVTGVIAGSYPAFFLSRLNTVKALRQQIRVSPRKGRQNMLLIFQFAISIGLIICTLFVHIQLQFTKNKALGYNKDNVIVLPLVSPEAQEQFDVLKMSFQQLPEVNVVSGSSEVPHAGFTQNGYFPEGHKQPMMIHVVDVDEDFLSAFDITLLEGQFFSKERPTTADGYLINEALAKQLEWELPLGKKIRRGEDHPVIGVVKDFHFASLHSKIEPLIITNQAWQGKYNLMSIRIQTDRPDQTLASLQKQWNKTLPDIPFEYWFLDAQFDQLYRAEERFEQAFLYFSLLAVCIGLLGVFSLTTLAIEHRTKEIGIRKVLGASTAGIARLISKDFLASVLIANLLAIPVAWYFMQNWLDNFAYHIPLYWWVFALAGGMTVLVAFLTVNSQSIKAALANPVEALRSE